MSGGFVPPTCRRGTRTQQTFSLGSFLPRRTLSLLFLLADVRNEPAKHRGAKTNNARLGRGVIVSAAKYIVTREPSSRSTSCGEHSRKSGSEASRRRCRRRHKCLFFSLLVRLSSLLAVGGAVLW